MEVMTAGAQKEIAYLTKYGQPLHPFQRLRREWVDFQRQSPSTHVDHLKKYLHVVPCLVPQSKQDIARPTLRHPDFQPSNVFVSDNLEITGLIDWQHCTILPLFLQSGIPRSFQNYGDEISESLTVPRLPKDYDEQNDVDQFERFRKRQIHYHYAMETKALNPTYGEALTNYSCILSRKLFDHAKVPWEADNITLAADLIELIQLWPNLNFSLPPFSSQSRCPIEFSESESSEISRLATGMEEADRTLRVSLDSIGAASEGWVPVERYEASRQCGERLKANVLGARDTEEEREHICEHWPFSDFDEGEYD